MTPETGNAVKEEVLRLGLFLAAFYLQMRNFRVNRIAVMEMTGTKEDYQETK